jgi:hypothetical protein
MKNDRLVMAVTVRAFFERHLFYPDNIFLLLDAWVLRFIFYAALGGVRSHALVPFEHVGSVLL